MEESVCVRVPEGEGLRHPWLSADSGRAERILCAQRLEETDLFLEPFFGLSGRPRAFRGDSGEGGGLIR